MKTNAAAATSVDVEDTIYTPVDAHKCAQTIYDIEQVQLIQIAETVHTSSLLRDKEQEHEDERGDQQRGKRRGDTILKATAACRVRVTAHSGRVDKGKGGKQNEGNNEERGNRTRIPAAVCEAAVTMLQRLAAAAPCNPCDILHER